MALCKLGWKSGELGGTLDIKSIGKKYHGSPLVCYYYDGSKAYSPLPPYKLRTWTALVEMNEANNYFIITTPPTHVCKP